VDDARFLLETVPGLGLSDAARDRVIALAGGATGSGVGCRI
jgi:hypothetical protein